MGARPSPLLCQLLAAVLLLHSAIGPARCLAHLAPLAAVAALCSPSANDTGPADAGGHPTGHVCPVCASLCHAITPTSVATTPVAVAWLATQGPSLFATQGPCAPRAPPLLPRAPPTLS